jgi:phage gpG-like protein
MANLNASDVTMNVNMSQLRALTLAASNIGVGRSCDVLVKFIKNSMRRTSWHNPSPAGGPPGTVTGNLRQSIQSTDPENGYAKVYTNWKYAAIQENGGIIRARNVKYLTIPMNVRAAKLRANTASLRTLNLHFTKGHRPGLAFLWETRGKGKNSRSELMFMLKPSVRLPARPFMRPAAQNPTVIANMGRAFTAGFVATIRKAFRARSTK